MILITEMLVSTINFIIHFTLQYFNLDFYFIKKIIFISLIRKLNLLHSGISKPSVISLFF